MRARRQRGHSADGLESISHRSIPSSAALGAAGRGLAPTCYRACLTARAAVHRFPAFGPARLDEVAVHARDHLELDLLGANRFAFANIGAAPEQFAAGLRHHALHALEALRLALRE